MTIFIKEIENQPSLKNLNLNLILTSDRYVLPESLNLDPVCEGCCSQIF